MLPFNNQYQDLCNNQDLVDILNFLLEDEYHLHGLHESTEFGTLTLIIKI